ncbi:MAG: hypothetical protein HQ518_25020 [Rhodopirellula sp.]|nr:hypothetical protein [Rhodopirellula sp.]
MQESGRIVGACSPLKTGWLVDEPQRAPSDFNLGARQGSTTSHPATVPN